MATLVLCKDIVHFDSATGRKVIGGETKAQNQELVSRCIR
jgi:hypothetical protein